MVIDKQCYVWAMILCIIMHVRVSTEKRIVKRELVANSTEIPLLILKAVEMQHYILPYWLLSLFV